jgi:IclR family acetate operon transcriptional repressor
MTSHVSADARGADRVQSVERTFAALEAIADCGGAISLSDLATGLGLPMPTVHRLMSTLLALGYVRRDQARRYVLGPGLMSLGEVAGRRLGKWARPYVDELARRVGESVNVAMLDGDHVVFVCEDRAVRNSMRMSSPTGRRVLPHSTAVGKALLAQMAPPEVVRLLGRTGMPSRTSRTITTPIAMARELSLVRRRGYAVDDEEQELGVRCVALLVTRSPVPMALSVSGPAPRMTGKILGRVLGPMAETAAAIAAELGRPLAP